MRLSDVNLENKDPIKRRRATVREKGNKERTVFLTNQAVKAMRAWLKERPEIRDDHFFLGHINGQPWQPLKVGGITEILRRYKKNLGISGRISPHQWRHRFARVHIQNGMDISMVSQTMGHTTIAVTELYYAQFNTDELQEAYDKAAPKVEENIDLMISELEPIAVEVEQP